MNSQKTKVMVSGPITSCQKNREAVLDLFILLVEGGSKITADGDCSHVIKRYLLFGRRAY